MWREGVAEGTIAVGLRGTDGFGYDPVFQPVDGGGRTFAELGPKFKNACSQRARAFRSLVEALGSAP